MFNFIAQNNGRVLSESVFYASNPTPLTGIASDTVAQAYSDTEALMTIYNSALKDLDKDQNQVIVPVFLKLTATAINTGATNFHIVGELSSSNRYTSGGTTLTSNSTSLDGQPGYTSRTAKSVVNFGDIVTTADLTQQRAFSTHISENRLAVDETIEIWFGEAPNMSSLNNVRVVPPVWIGRESSLVIHGFGASQTVSPDFMVEFCFLETGHKRFSL